MIIDWLEEWFKGVLIDGIIGQPVGPVRYGEYQRWAKSPLMSEQTPQGWNCGIFTMIHNLSETVIVPIAGAILAFVMCL